jgi:hypothetical protein
VDLLLLREERMAGMGGRMAAVVAVVADRPG